MDETDKWYSVTQASEEVGIPSQTVRRYIRQFGDFIYSKRGEKRSYLVHESSLDTLKRIRYLLDNDYERERINEILGQTEQVIIQQDDERMDELFKSLPEIHRQTEESIKAMNQHISEQNQAIKNMSEQLERQQNYIQESLSERDTKLMGVMNELLEERKQQKEEQQKGFFKRLFGK